jgi:predicted Zn-dependent protease
MKEFVRRRLDELHGNGRVIGEKYCKTSRCRVKLLRQLSESAEAFDAREHCGGCLERIARIQRRRELLRVTTPRAWGSRRAIEDGGANA